jgi:uncharacterized Zn finger protein
MSDLNEWLTPEALADYAGDVIYRRGAAYFHQGAVSRLRDAGDNVTARVHGTEAYRVELWTDGQEFGYDCTCPHAAEGHFCKHCVAVGLAFLDGRARGYEPGTSGDEAWDAIYRHLQDQSPETLADWLLAAAQQDDRLWRKLLLKAQRAGGKVDLAKVFRREIDNATRTHGFIDYDEAAEFAEDLDQLVDSLEELQTPESSALLAELADYAIEKIEQAMDNVDDSDGGLMDVLERLQELRQDAGAGFR